MKIEKKLKSKDLQPVTYRLRPDQVESLQKLSEITGQSQNNIVILAIDEILKQNQPKKI